MVKIVTMVKKLENAGFNLVSIIWYISVRDYIRYRCITSIPVNLLQVLHLRCCWGLG